jgi:hypothetical protein
MEPGHLTPIVAGVAALIFTFSIIVDFFHKEDWANPYRLFALATCIGMMIFWRHLP